MTRKATTNNLEETDNQPEESEQSILEDQPSPEERGRDSTPGSNKKRRINPDIEYLSEVVRGGIQSRQQREAALEEDDDRLFLLSLLKPIKKLPETTRFDVRMQIMDVIHKATKATASNNHHQSLLPPAANQHVFSHPPLINSTPHPPPHRNFVQSPELNSFPPDNNYSAWRANIYSHQQGHQNFQQHSTDNLQLLSDTAPHQQRLQQFNQTNFRPNAPTTSTITWCPQEKRVAPSLPITEKPQLSDDTPISPTSHLSEDSTLESVFSDT